MKVKVLYDHCHTPYLARLNLLTLFGWRLKLHIFIRSDMDEELHDHPWDFWSWVIAGEYGELTPEGLTLRKTWSLVFRRATWKHRVLLGTNGNGKPSPCATLILMKPVSREWGFWKDNQFIPWREFHSSRKCE